MARAATASGRDRGGRDALHICHFNVCPEK